MYKLIGSPRTRAIRVAWMLSELGVEFEYDPSPPRHPSVSALNPSGKVPILLDDGEKIFDSVAICQYLADKHGRFTFPAGTILRAQQDGFTQFAVDELEGPLWTAAKHTFVLPKEYRVAAAIDTCRYDFGRGIATFEQRLGDNHYVMGDDFTVPDVFIGHCLGWAEKLGWEIPSGNISDYLARIRSRPAFIQAKAALEDSETASTNAHQK